MQAIQAHILKKFSVTLVDTEYQIPLTYHVHAADKAQAKAIAISHACREQGIGSNESHPFKVERVTQEK